MSIAFSLLLICIVFAAGTAIQDNAASQSLLALFIAAALASIGVSTRAADVKFAGQVTKGLKLIAAIPAGWMILQILPTPIGANSIWSYANQALDRQAWGHISLDPGRSLGAVAWYIANIALIVVSLFATIDRRRAELVLFVLTGATGLTTIGLLIASFGLLPGVSAEHAPPLLSAFGALGVLFAVTSGARAFERLSKSAKGSSRPTEILLAFLASGVGLVCSAAGLAASASLNMGLIVFFGIAIFASAQIVRRIGLGGWAIVTLAATLTLAAAMIFVWRYDPTRPLSPFLQFAGTSSADALSAAQRMLADSGWRGTGAGTFAKTLPLYQELGAGGTPPPTTASALVIELGWPIAIVIIISAGWLAITLYRGALERGRDSFYPAAACACTVVAVGQAFCDATLLNSSIAVIIDVTIGLGLAQSVSRREGP
ncbi:hypothetical protein [Bradyrhizobium sp. MOS002]|uniref:hypothetical protein n=1 Tax=Bradyrhizobium sp. MOS002 TaxID=2133947 RepID=UPI000D11EF91|nr:hypothetical protein [Bradyrhizobium sp. MOS002]PSO25955.1 hypothetical protein C7G41_28655 [Bradyrhizobium sp. MOS002]